MLADAVPSFVQSLSPAQPTPGSTLVALIPNLPRAQVLLASLLLIALSYRGVPPSARQP